MIEVKGIRSAAPVVDPTDPLGFRKPAVVGSGLLVGLAGGLLGLAMYLRSFLWFDPQAAAVAGAPGAGGAPQDGAAPGAPSVRAAAVSGSSTSGGDGSASAEAADAATMTLPVVFGPFDSGIFAPLLMASDAISPSADPANSVLPPFRFRPSSPNSGDSRGAGPGGPDLEVGDLAGAADVDDDDAAPGSGPGPNRNRAPQNLGPVYLGEVGSGAVLAIAMSSLLAKSADADGDALSVSRASSTVGTIQPRGDGLRYVADSDELGMVKITYQVTDGKTNVTQTAFVNVVENRFEGTDGGEWLLGTEGRDRMTARAGDDDIAAFGGRDVVFGGLGDDNISGGAGRDTLHGDEGNDLIAGGADADWIYGGAGDDRLYGEAGDDHVDGDAGNDLLDGGDGRDTLAGGAGDDTVAAGEGDDVAAGGAGQDRLSGQAGSDVLFGDDGADTLAGDAGEDVLFGGLSDDLLEGGADNDVLAGDAGNDTVLGGTGADLASGGEGDDLVEGGLGNDILLGEAGDDVLACGAGADQHDGGLGDDRFVADSDAASDMIAGGEGFDLVSFAAMSEDLSINLILDSAVGVEIGEDAFSGIEAFVGGSGDDIFIAGEGQATLTGNGGSDTYEFVQGDTLDRSHASYRVTDFGYGDIISLVGNGSAFEICQAQRELEDRLDNLFQDFADRLETQEPKLRYFHEWAEDFRRTVVEVDFDRDDNIDLTLSLDGELVLDVLRAQA